MNVERKIATPMRSDPDYTVRFGTSGLRGKAEAFTPEICSAYVAAFIEVAKGASCGNTIYIGCDRRESSPAIASHICTAIRECGFEPVYCGVVATPALAAHGFARSCLSIMVTGSHIAATYNGIKFHRCDGELAKVDEAEIVERAIRHHSNRSRQTIASLPTADQEAMRLYAERFKSVFPRDLLSGTRLGIDLHSGAGTELVAQTLEGLGASVVRLGQSDEFIALDTEALEPERLSLYRSWLDAHRLDGIVSTDGDGDRPLLIDETGEQVAGDLLGLMTARFLGIDQVVTPVTSTSAIEATGWFSQVVRTKVGSPFVVAEMMKQRGRVAGFEANGGFLLGCDIALAGGTLGRLPTRDGLLPLIASLAFLRVPRQKISAVTTILPRRVKLSDRLRDIAPEAALGLLAGLVKSASLRSSFDPCLVDPVEIDLTDGVRLVCQDGSVVHFRRSGNAPEFRCYVEAREKDDARALLARLMGALAAHFDNATAVPSLASASH